MCAPNKTKKGNKEFSYLFRTHLIDQHYLPWCQAAKMQFYYLLAQKETVL